MITSDTANKTSSQPLERIKTAAQKAVINPDEQIEGIDSVGYFENPTIKEPIINCINAPCILIDNFNPDKVVPLSVVSNLFGGSDQWISITPALNSVASAASKAVNLAGNLASDSKDAGLDLFNQVIGKTETSQDFQKASDGEDDSKLNHDAVAKKQEAEEYSVIKQQEESIDAEILNIRRDLDIKAKIAPLQEEVADLMGLQAMLSGKSSLVKENGEIRVDLQASVAQKRKEILESRHAGKSIISSPAKHGAEGPRLSNDDNKSVETHATAQTAIG